MKVHQMSLSTNGLYFSKRPMEAGLWRFHFRKSETKALLSLHSCPALARVSSHTPQGPDVHLMLPFTPIERLERFPSAATGSKISDCSALKVTERPKM